MTFLCRCAYCRLPVES